MVSIIIIFQNEDFSGVFSNRCFQLNLCLAHTLHTFIWLEDSAILRASIWKLVKVIKRSVQSVMTAGPYKLIYEVLLIDDGSNEENLDPLYDFADRWEGLG